MKKTKTRVYFVKLSVFEFYLGSASSFLRGVFRSFLDVSIASSNPRGRNNTNIYVHVETDFQEEV